MSKRERESLHLRAKTFELTAVLMKMLSEREKVLCIQDDGEELIFGYRVIGSLQLMEAMRSTLERAF